MNAFDKRSSQLYLLYCNRKHWALYTRWKRFYTQMYLTGLGFDTMASKTGLNCQQLFVLDETYAMFVAMFVPSDLHSSN